jgi:CheY-like chemotaxis protein
MPAPNYLPPVVVSPINPTCARLAAAQSPLSIFLLDAYRLGPVCCRAIYACLRGVFRRNMRILVVDDNSQVRAAILSILMTDPRLEVISEATNGTEAIQLAQTLQPDLILLDIGLPDLNGLEVAQHLANIAPRSAVLFLSQHTSTEIVNSTVSSGAMGYVVKSDAAAELVPAVLAAGSGRKYLSKRVRFPESETGS